MEDGSNKRVVTVSGRENRLAPFVLRQDDQAPDVAGGSEASNSRKGNPHKTRSQTVGNGAMCRVNPIIY